MKQRLLSSTAMATLLDTFPQWWVEVAQGMWEGPL